MRLTGRQPRSTLPGIASNTLGWSSRYASARLPCLFRSRRLTRTTVASDGPTSQRPPASTVRSETVRPASVTRTVVRVPRTAPTAAPSQAPSHRRRAMPDRHPQTARFQSAVVQRTRGVPTPVDHAPSAWYRPPTTSYLPGSDALCGSSSSQQRTYWCSMSRFHRVKSTCELGLVQPRRVVTDVAVVSFRLRSYRTCRGGEPLRLPVARRPYAARTPGRCGPRPQQ